MRIGITYDLKSDVLPQRSGQAALPDDFQEEFDSPVTVEGIAGALRALGHHVDKLGDGRELIATLLASPPDFVFNLAEGQGIGRSREARVPAFLEMLGIPYTGSDPLTLAVTLDKDCAKRLVQSAGLPVPWGVVLRPDENPRHVVQSVRSRLPIIAKPAWEGSSKGIRGHCVVERLEELPAVIDSLRRDHRQPVLLEEFIHGDELTVGIVGNGPPQIIGVMRVLPRQKTGRFIYSLEVKRDFVRQVRYECPAQLPASVTKAVTEAALEIYRTLGCRDVARIDFRLREGVPYFLEVNPLPGLNPDTSDLVIMARLAGWSYGQLIQSIWQAALDRCR
jgi:D-alanine-D-alanine ligase